MEQQPEREGDKVFWKCDICGKNLIQRSRANGMWYFRFGRFGGVPLPVVEMILHGSLLMKCLRKSCRQQNPDHWVELHFLPKSTELNSVKQVK